MAATDWQMGEENKGAKLRIVLPAISFTETEPKTFIA